MNKKEKAINIYKAIEKATDKIIASNAKEYLKPLKDKPWQKLAIKQYKAFAKLIYKLLNKYKNAYIKAIKGKKLFKLKQKIKKDIDDEYLDEQYNFIVSDNIRDILKELNADFEKELQEVYKKEVANKTKEAAKLITAGIGMKFDFNRYDKLTRNYLRNKKIKWAKQVQKTTEKIIKQILVQGFEDGLGSYDIADMIAENAGFNFARAETIARTEIIGSCNYADMVIHSLDDNIVAKKWSATAGSRTRNEHAAADGQIKLINEPFVVWGEKLMYPGDTSLGASAKNVINCRCTMFFLDKKEYEREAGDASR